MFLVQQVAHLSLSWEDREEYFYPGFVCQLPLFETLSYLPFFPLAQCLE